MSPGAAQRRELQLDQWFAVDVRSTLVHTHPAHAYICLSPGSAPVAATQDLYRSINKMKDSSFIRVHHVESDKVTYPMHVHIILQYEIE